jgi:uncharacterized protein YeaO (DUF488 family)
MPARMLARYQIVRGKRPPDDPLPDGIRIDTRKHTRHVLRPEADAVRALFADPSAAGFSAFAKRYRATLDARFAADRAPFDALAAQAREQPVYIGCNCPSRANPNVQRCHTVLALAFMKRKYPKLEVVLPK